MTDIKYEREEIEEVKRYVKKTIVDYRLYCDKCNKEIHNNDKYFEVTIYRDMLSKPDEEKCLCCDCTKELSADFVKSDNMEIDISREVFRIKDHLGVSHRYDSGLDDIALKLKFNKNRGDF